MPFADLSDVRCHYEIMGNGDPLLMIAGLGSTCEIWGAAAEELAKSLTLILADNRNMGRSVGRRMPQCLADFSSDYVELLDHLQLDRAHVLGLSLGGIIAQKLAVDHPSRIDRLVLVSCTTRVHGTNSLMALRSAAGKSAVIYSSVSRSKMAFFWASSERKLLTMHTARSR